jgi:divalent metal cation (Fe/Co/Zn/Cd) transporter
MTQELVILLIGQAPPGYEILQYVAGLIIAIFTLKVIYEMFYFVINLVKGN